MTAADRNISLAACAVGLIIGTSYTAGVHWNTSPSMPMGLWTVSALRGPVKRGDVVTLCLPENTAAFGRARGYLSGGECPGDTELLIKPVAAVAGDTVVVSADGISVNDVLVAGSRALPQDDLARPVTAMDPGMYRVGADEVWVISGYDRRSYDSRYYGAIPSADLRGRGRPVWTDK